jgi:hypothetical protein
MNRFGENSPLPTPVVQEKKADVCGEEGGDVLLLFCRGTFEELDPPNCASPKIVRVRLVSPLVYKSASAETQ